MQSYSHITSATKFSYDGDSLQILFKREASAYHRRNTGQTCSFVVTVKDEASNIEPLFATLSSFIDGNNGEGPVSNLPYIKEIVFVDGRSKDGTVEKLKQLSEMRHSFSVVVARQPAGTKLAYAEYLGATISSGDYIIKIDGDGQHNVSTALEMLKNAPGNDIVIASRYIGDGGSSWSPLRGTISRIARAEFHAMFPSQRGVKDPLSGFFLCKKDVLPDIPPHKDGFKYLMHILALKPDAKLQEVPFVISERAFGESKILATGHRMILNYNRELLYCVKLRHKIAKPLPV